MFQFQLPLRDMRFVAHELLDASAAFAAMEPAPCWDASTIDQAIEAVGRFAQRELVPLNASGDAQGCRLAEGTVETPRGFAQAYRRFVDAGWPTLACDEDHGGQGAPALVLTAALEILYAANPGWTMYFGTARGAYECLVAHASQQLKDEYLAKIVSGRWTTTMCITESQAGSDLGLLRTRAVPQDDESYRISGEKIFISGGDHDVAENVVHLVLARLPGAPQGVAGVSLFLVPKRLPEGAGLARQTNGVTATAVEHKMGLRGSATCAMAFDGATGWLVGRPNEGLRCMFVMINSSRVGVAVQAVGMGQAAHVSALHHARERLQMRAAGGARRADLPADPIIEHADVRRMLLTQKAHVEASRMFVYWLSLLLDQAAREPDPAARQHVVALVGLLTPVAKSFLTENGFEVASLAIQIHGGHGYIRDQGVEQIARDVRIAQIYEGTNGIQARDLLTRKVLGDRGAALERLFERIRSDVRGGLESLPDGFAGPLMRLCDELGRLTADVAAAAMIEPDEIGAAGSDFLRALGYLVSGWLFARAAALAVRRLAEGTEDPFYAAKLETARFYIARLLPNAGAHIVIARAGLASLGTLPEERLFV